MLGPAAPRRVVVGDGLGVLVYGSAPVAGGGGQSHRELRAGQVAAGLHFFGSLTDEAVQL